MSYDSDKVVTKGATLGWWFGPNDGRLRYGDGRIVKKGGTHKLSTKHELSKCSYGLHACTSVEEALAYASNEACTLWRVELTDAIEERYYTKLYAKKRKYLYKVENSLETIRGILYKEALKVSKTQGFYLDPELVDYMKDPQSTKHVAIHKKLKDLDNIRKYSGGKVEDSNCWNLVQNIKSTIPGRNKDSFVPISGLVALQHCLSNTPSVNRVKQVVVPSEEDCFKAMERMLGVPKTKLEKDLKAYLLKKEARNMGTLYYHFSHDYERKLEQERADKLKNKMFKLLEKEGN